MQPNAVDWTTVLLSLISLIGTLGTAILAYLANKNATQARTEGVKTSEKVDGLVSATIAAKDDQIARAEAQGRAEGVVEGMEKPLNSAAPLPVEVVNPAPIEVTETPKES